MSHIFVASERANCRELRLDGLRRYPLSLLRWPVFRKLRYLITTLRLYVIYPWIIWKNLRDDLRCHERHYDYDASHHDKNAGSQSEIRNSK